MDEINDSQNKFETIINNIIRFNKISHSYLIEMEDNEDNLNSVLSFIKLILCNKESKNKSSLNCNKCNICKLIDDNNYPDLKIVEPDGNWIKKGQLLNLQSEYQNKSLLNNKRIYIIKNAEKLNDSSANTILKFLEEPEDDIIAILLTNNRYKVLDTILSRCQILTLNSNSIDYFVEDIDIELIKLINEPNMLFTNYNYIYNNILIDKIIAKKKFITIENIYIQYLNFISGNKVDFFDERILEILNNNSQNKLISYISIIEEEIQKLDYNINYKLWLDNLYAKFVEVK